LICKLHITSKQHCSSNETNGVKENIIHLTWIIDNAFANLEELDIKAKRFDYNELRVATKNFAEDRKLGAGAYGVVYKVIMVNVIGLKKTNTHSYTCCIIWEVAKYTK
jgi:hypothetical protein